MALIDILIVGLVLAFVVSRFIKHDLPKDPRAPKERKGDWQELFQRLTPMVEGEEVPAAKPSKRKAKVVDVAGLQGVELLRAYDDGFDETRFKDGMEKAYRYFYDRWNAMDVEGLDKLCGPELLAQLEASLEDYKARGAKPEVVVNAVDSLEIVDVRIKAKTAVVHVRIVARVSEGEVGVQRKGKDGTQALPQPVQAVWVLARALTSDDPNWELQKIVHEGAKA